MLYPAGPLISACYGCLQGEPAMCSWVGEFPQYQLIKVTTAHLVCMLHVSAHVIFSEIQASWHHAIKKTGPAHRDSFAKPFFTVLLNVLLDFSSEKSAESRQSFHNIYLNTQLQGKVVFTFWFGFSLGWRGLGIKELMLRTDNGGDHWIQSVRSCNGTIVNNAPAALFSSVLEKFEMQLD